MRTFVIVVEAEIRIRLCISSIGFWEVVRSVLPDVVVEKGVVGIVDDVDTRVVVEMTKFVVVVVCDMVAAVDAAEDRIYIQIYIYIFDCNLGWFGIWF